MKKYIIPALHVADIENEVLLVNSLYDKEGYGESGYEGGYAHRRGRRKQNDDEFYYEDDIDEEDF